MREGLRRHGLAQAALQLRPRALARRAIRVSRPPPVRPAARPKRGWRTFEAFDIMSMPDMWEYPWFAAWDLAFHCVDARPRRPGVRQVPAVSCSAASGSSTPTARCPAYEWSFDDVNPPVQAWAALRGVPHRRRRDLDFLARVFAQAAPQLHLVGQPGPDGSNLFEGGFLGLDNIGPIDRSHLPAGGRLSRPTHGAGWRSTTLTMLEMALDARPGAPPAPTDLAIKFLEHFALIAEAIRPRGCGTRRTGSSTTASSSATAAVRGARCARSSASCRCSPPSLDEQLIGRSRCSRRVRAFARATDATRRPWRAPASCAASPASALLSGSSPPTAVAASSRELFDEGEFLSPYGLRAFSACHREHPSCSTLGGCTATSTTSRPSRRTGMFGGNSNWRGPSGSRSTTSSSARSGRYGAFVGDDVTVEYPTGSGQRRR